MCDESSIIKCINNFINTKQTFFHFFVLLSNSKKPKYSHKYISGEMTAQTQSVSSTINDGIEELNKKKKREKAQL